MVHIIENQQQDLTRISQRRGDTDEDRRFRRVHVRVKNERKVLYITRP